MSSTPRLYVTIICFVLKASAAITVAAALASISPMIGTTPQQFGMMMVLAIALLAGDCLLSLVSLIEQRSRQK